MDLETEQFQDSTWQGHDAMGGEIAGNYQLPITHSGDTYCGSASNVVQPSVLRQAKKAPFPFNSLLTLLK